MRVMSTIHENISHTVQNNTNVALKTYRLTDTVEGHIRFAIEQILDKVKKVELLHVLYTIVKELVVNGCKANQKRIFFEERDYDIHDQNQYVVGAREYRAAISEHLSSDMGIKARKHGYYVIIDFNYTPDGIKINVINNTSMAKQEEEILHIKLQKAMGYNDISEFYMDNMDEIESGEGAGLGLALIIILLKAEGFDPNLFRIQIQKDQTIARLEIPFSANNESYGSL